MAVQEGNSKKEERICVIIQKESGGKTVLQSRLTERE